MDGTGEEEEGGGGGGGGGGRLLAGHPALLLPVYCTPSRFLLPTNRLDAVLSLNLLLVRAHGGQFL